MIQKLMLGAHGVWGVLCDLCFIQKELILRERNGRFCKQVSKLHSIMLLQSTTAANQVAQQASKQASKLRLTEPIFVEGTITNQQYPKHSH